MVAAGRGHVAATILTRARDAACPYTRTRSWPSALAMLALGDEVPEELWTAVAEVLAWAYGLSYGLS